VAGGAALTAVSPEQYCQDRAAASGSSFYYSFLFLPPDKRRAITALYAFCREVDDVADECTDPDRARAMLAWWRGEVDAIFAGQPQHPVGAALLPVVRDFELPPERFHEIIDGMEMDIRHSRYPDFALLQLYCYRVAGTVGALAAEIFGYVNPRTLKYAHDLGLAFQLTNIIRDVGEDARRGRIYLPEDELKRFHVTPSEILCARHSERFQALMEFQIRRAEDLYGQALAALPAEDRRAQKAGLVMAAIYRTLLEEIRRDGCRVLQQRTALTPIRKLWIAWLTWLRG
jgi:15-cis-phytoene synthase